MKHLLNECLGWLLLAKLGSAAILVCAQPSKAKQVLTTHTIRVGQPNDKLASPTDIHLENKADTAYVRKDWQEDMGYVYALQYVFKDNLPDGVYRLFINDKIQQEIIFINGKKEGVHKSYLDGNLNIEMPFRNGRANGYARSYQQGREVLQSIFYLYDDQPYIRTSVDLDGNVVGREYFVNSNHFRVEEKKSGWRDDSDPPLTQNGVAVKEGTLRSGLYELASSYGKYQLFFNRNNLKWWRWLDKEGNKVVEVHAKPGQRL